MNNSGFRFFVIFSIFLLYNYLTPKTLKAEDKNIIESETINSGYLIFEGKLIEPPYKIELIKNRVEEEDDEYNAVRVNSIIIYEIKPDTKESKRKQFKTEMRQKYHNLKKQYSEEEANNKIENEILKRKGVKKTNLLRNKSEVSFEDGNITDFELEGQLNEYEIESSFGKLIVDSYKEWFHKYGKEKSLKLLKELLEKEKSGEILDRYVLTDDGGLTVYYKYAPEQWQSFNGVDSWIIDEENKKRTPPPSRSEVMKGKYKRLVKFLNQGWLEIISKKGTNISRLPGEAKNIVKNLRLILKQNITDDEKINKIKDVLEIPFNNNAKEILNNFISE